MQNALLLGLICGVLDIIPYFGPFIGAAPAFLFALSQDMKTAVLLVIGITIIQFGESYVVSPIVMNKVLHIHPIIAVFFIIDRREFIRICRNDRCAAGLFDRDGHGRNFDPLLSAAKTCKARRKRK